jgi:hypothetical protein
MQPPRLSLMLIAVTLRAQSPDPAVFFERRVRPVLADKC